MLDQHFALLLTSHLLLVEAVRDMPATVLEILGSMMTSQTSTDRRIKRSAGARPSFRQCESGCAADWRRTGQPS